MIPSRWRPALRIALRDVRKSPGRAALVLLMVGLPVLLVSMLATLYRSYEISAVESIPRKMGATQALVEPQGRQPFDQNPQGEIWILPQPAPGPEKPWQPQEIEQVTGRTAIAITNGSALVRTKTGALPTNVFLGDFQRPELAGYLTLNSGRFPTAENEVLVSKALADRGFTAGKTISTDTEGSPPLKVVGIGRTSADEFGVNEQIIGRPQAKIGGEFSTNYLLDGAPISWAQVREFNGLGLAVTSRAVIQNPPENWRSTLSDPSLFSDFNVANRSQQAVLGLIVFSIVLEIILLAGPAFAVGERRARRHLALMSATGASPADLRRVILAQGTVFGALAALIGVGLSIPFSALLTWVIPQFTARVTFGPFDVYWVMVSAAGLLGAIASMAAAFLPARAASRVDVVAVLAGRSGQSRQRLGLPLVGGVIYGIGLLIVLILGTKQDGEVKVAAGTLLLVAGALMLIPAVLGWVGRLGKWLPLPLRLAARDSARQRSRTTPAVAAIMGAVAALTALSVGLSSDTEQSRREYQPRFAPGTTEIQLGSSTAWDQAKAAVAKYAPEKPLLAVGEVTMPQATGAAIPAGVYVATGACPKEAPQRPTGRTANCLSWVKPPINDDTSHGYQIRNNLVADPDAVAAFGITLNESQRRVLATGGALVANPEAISAQGTVDFQTYQGDGTGDKQVVGKMRQLPAAYANPRRTLASGVEYTGFIITPDTAQKLGGWRQQAALIPRGEAALTKKTEAQIAERLKGLVSQSDLYTERGFVSQAGLPLLLLLVTGALVVLVGTLTATGLALADSKPDSATLAAIGATPRTRRALAAGQAVVIALLGVLTGIFVGIVPGVAAAVPLTIGANLPGDSLERSSGPIIDIPWGWLSVFALGVPVLAAMVAGSTVRSKMVMTRRLGQ